MSTTTENTAEAFGVTPVNKVKRVHERGRYDKKTVYEILDDSRVAMQIACQRHVTHRRQTLGLGESVLVKPIGFRKNQHPCAPAFAGQQEVSDVVSALRGPRFGT